MKRPSDVTVLWSGGADGTGGGGSAEVNLRQALQGPRRMSLDPDSSMPPTTTANRPDQKPAAVTQHVVARCAAVRNMLALVNQRISAGR